MPNQFMNYFDSQLLTADDLKLDQSYHASRLQHHQAHFHTPGIAAGLEVNCKKGDSFVLVTEGTAVDDLGRQITIEEKEGRKEELHEIPVTTEAKEYFVAIEYATEGVEPKVATPDGEQFPRFRETPNISFPEKSLGLHQIALGKIMVQNGKIAVDNPTDTLVRPIAAFRTPEVSTETLKMVHHGDVETTTLGLVLLKQVLSTPQPVNPTGSPWNLKIPIHTTPKSSPVPILAIVNLTPITGIIVWTLAADLQGDTINYSVAFQGANNVGASATVTQIYVLIGKNE